MAAQRIQDLKMQEENMNKQITIRKSNNTRNLIRTEPEELISKELNNRVTENSKEIGELWTAVATLTQAQSDHWQYSRQQEEVNTLMQLRRQLESDISDIKAKLRSLELEKKIAKLEGDNEQTTIKERLNKHKDKWRNLQRELGEERRKSRKDTNRWTIPTKHQ
eukprot:TRINITY_DN2102_c0_g3_i2.p1 TRINITY_DN2102_c0_g3~~TRINITY_DN2102_c0_g3_i2.p1  ORF type:complete len:164 (+),score=30.44 TRINITY_DN2102_c0_g3_i2:86-577(+)